MLHAAVPVVAAGAGASAGPSLLRNRRRCPPAAMLACRHPARYNACVVTAAAFHCQVARCTKIINPNTEEAKYVINIKQIAKFVVGLGEKVRAAELAGPLMWRPSLQRQPLMWQQLGLEVV